MRIAINGMFWTEPFVGSGQYLHHLVEHFSRHSPQHRFVLVIPRYRLVGRPKPTLPHIQIVAMPTPFDGRSDNLAKLWFEQIAFGQVCRKLRVDLAHVPYFGSPRLTPVPVIVTVHDLIPLLLPENRGGRAVQAYMRLSAAAARQARLIIADSHHTKADVVQHLGVAPERVTVTHLAASDELQPQSAAAIAAAEDRYKLADPYILYIGGFQAHKNVATAIRAFARARKQFGRRILLAIAGRQPTSTSPLFPDINRVILEEGVADDVVLLGPISEAEKAALMSGCQAFVFPSRYEGFGLPPLEAMQCGAPTLASETTSVGEIVGDGGIQLPPTDVDAWAGALARVVGPDGASEQAQLKARGLQRAAEFSWAKTAEQTLALYEQLHTERRG